MPLPQTVSRAPRPRRSCVRHRIGAHEAALARLTLAGASYAQEIREALKRVSAATLGFRANPQGGALNLAILPAFGTRWLAPRLPAFLQRNPSVTINLTTRLAPFDFQLETVDAAIHFGLPEWSGAELDFLMTESVVPACSQGLLDEYRFRRPDDLLRAPLLHPASRHDAWQRWFQSMSVDVREVPGMLVDQFAVATQAAMAGLGVALLPQFLIESELRSGDLVKAIDAPRESEGRYYLAWPTHRAAYPPLKAFREWIVEEARAA